MLSILTHAHRFAPLTMLAICSAWLSACDASSRCYIQRNFDSPQEESLIRAAEAVYPPREDVVALAVTDAYGVSPSELPEDHAWWYGMWGGVRMPYAITAEAIAYFADRVRKAPLWPMTSMMYTADIEYNEAYELDGEQFRGVYVVTMHLTYGYYCGPLCAAGISKGRTVVLTPEGAWLYVSGDGRAGMMIS